MRLTSARSGKRATPAQPRAAPPTRATKKWTWGWKMASRESPWRFSGGYSAARWSSSSEIRLRTSSDGVVVSGEAVVEV